MLRITDIQENRVDWDTVPYCEITTQDMEKYRLKKWDLVFARTGATVGKSFLIRDDLSNAVYASYLIRVRCIDEHLAVFLSHFFNSPVYWDQITEFSAGIGQPNVNGSKLKELTLPLAPLAEQKVIADKLDALLAQVDTLKARLDAIPAILKHFRQSVLSAAVTGKLTEDWRRSKQKQGGVKYVELGHDRFECPQVWAITSLRSIISDSRPLCYGVVQPGENGSAGVPLIRVQDMERGRIKIDELRSILSSVDEEYRRSRVSSGDLLVSVVGTIGRLAIVPDGFEGNIARAVARIACDEGVQTKWVHYWMSTQAIQWWLVSSSKEVARKTLNLSELGEMPIALPSPEEQTEIVRRVESLFAFAEQIEARAQEATARVRHLTQSILAKAFRGELTEEWRKAHPDLVSGENSATALLDRIRATQAATPEAKGKPGRKAQHSPSEARLVGEDFSPSPNAPKKRGRPRKG